MKTGPLNLITDVAGLHVGNAEDSRYVPALLQSCSS
jgi:L-aminopeptidase/D-esterase-like protein